MFLLYFIFSCIFFRARPDQKKPRLRLSFAKFGRATPLAPTQVNVLSAGDEEK